MCIHSLSLGITEETFWGNGGGSMRDHMINNRTSVCMCLLLQSLEIKEQNISARAGGDID